jgi:hypothetical protein
VKLRFTRIEERVSRDEFGRKNQLFLIE